MKPQILLLAIASLFLSILTACGPSETLPTGVPAASAEKFFFHMEHEARDQRLETYRSSENDLLTVYADQGDLDYRVQIDEIVVTLSTDEGEHETAEAPYHRLDSLRDLHERLLEGAIQRARRVDPFSQAELP